MDKIGSFFGESNQGYLIIAQQGTFIPGQREAIVLGVNVGRSHDRYVTWRASRNGAGKAVYWSGTYRHTLTAAVNDLQTR